MKRVTMLAIAAALLIAVIAGACSFSNDPNAELVATVSGRISDAEVQAICNDNGFPAGFGRYARQGNAGQVTLVYCYLNVSATVTSQ